MRLQRVDGGESRTTPNALKPLGHKEAIYLVNWRRRRGELVGYREKPYQLVDDRTLGIREVVRVVFSEMVWIGRKEQRCLAIHADEESVLGVDRKHVSRESDTVH